MNPLTAAVSLVLGFGLQAVLWPDVTLLMQPAFLLVIALLVGFNRGLAPGFWFAFTAGLLLDFYAQQRFGLFTFAMLLAYLPAFIYWQTRTNELTLPTKITLTVTAACIYELVLLVVIRLGNSEFAFFAELLQVATLNVVGSVIAYAVLAPLFSALLAKSPHERSL